jgi:translation initiation factor 2B subunit (eIF-2B alpha/beta/delta family)
LNPAARNKLQKILSDNKSGSSEILLKLISWSKSNSTDKKTLLEMINIVKNELRSFSSIQAFIKELKKVVNSNNNLEISNFLNQQDEKIKNRFGNLFKNSLSYLKNSKRIVTLSNSRTLIEILKKLNEITKINVLIGESRPQLEGRIMAKELLNHKVRIEIIPDALLPSAAEKSDIAIIGADMVLSNGDVVNKIGSKSLALACKYFKKPFYVLAISDKFSQKKKYVVEARNGNEIWNYDNEFLTRTNYYFEVVERRLITKIITDKKS